MFLFEPATVAKSRYHVAAVRLLWWAQCVKLIRFHENQSWCSQHCLSIWYQHLVESKTTARKLKVLLFITAISTRSIEKSAVAGQFTPTWFITHLQHSWRFPSRVERFTKHVSTLTQTEQHYSAFIRVIVLLTQSLILHFHYLQSLWSVEFLQ